MPFSKNKMADCLPLPEAEEVVAVAGAFYSKRGNSVELSEEDTVAIIGGVHKFYNKKITMRRVVFSREPINVRDTFQVHAVRRPYGRYYDGYAFGTKLPDPNTPKGFFEVRPGILREPQQNMVSSSTIIIIYHWQYCVRPSSLAPADACMRSTSWTSNHMPHGRDHAVTSQLTELVQHD